MRLIPTLALLFAMVSPATAQDDKIHSIGSDIEDVKAERLKQTFVRLNKAATSADRIAYQNLFLPEGVMFLPDRPPLLGREAIGRWAEEFMRSVVLVTDQYEQVQIDIVGDVAIVRSRGSGRYILKKTGEEFPLHNKFIDILRYVDGEWLFSHHLASSSSLEPGLWDLQWESDGVLPD